MPERLVRRYQSLNPWHVVWFSVLLAEAVAFAASSTVSLILTGQVKGEFLIAGAVNALAVSLAISVSIVYCLVKEQRRAEKTLRESARFLETIFGSIRDPFIIYDKDFRIVKVNEEYAQFKNIPIDEMIGGKRCFELQGREKVCEDCVVEKTFNSANPCAKDKHLTLHDGSEAWVEIYTYPIFDDYARVSHVIEYIRDITDRKKAELEIKHLVEKLKHLSRTDGLTGLLNKRAILDRIEYEVGRARRYRSPLSIIICDLDYFKEINDNYGHDVGDKVLQAVSSTLVVSVRMADIIGRFGGDEFMLILPQTPPEGAAGFAERIRSEAEKILIPGYPKIHITVSLGIAGFDGGAEDYQMFIKRADAALYTSKREGRNQIHTAS